MQQLSHKCNKSMVSHFHCNTQWILIDFNKNSNERLKQLLQKTHCESIKERVTYGNKIAEK